jgi:hypothetical protein
MVFLCMILYVLLLASKRAQDHQNQSSDSKFALNYVFAYLEF